MHVTRFSPGPLFMTVSVRQARYVSTRKTVRMVSFVRVYAMPVMVTFVLAGLWHGSSWTFAVFGAWWGIALVINHAWRQARLVRLPVWLAWVLTMLGALIGMVMFRSPDLDTCVTVLASMAGLGPAPVPSQLVLAKTLAMILLVTAACLVAPNTPQVMDGWKISVDSVQKTSGILSWRWRLDARGLAFTAFVLIGLAIAGEQTSPFLYYQF